jgi:hypothetical protein
MNDFRQMTETLGSVIECSHDGLSKGVFTHQHQAVFTPGIRNGDDYGI